jgi:hypothetical protein
MTRIDSGMHHSLSAVAYLRNDQGRAALDSSIRVQQDSFSAADEDGRLGAMALSGAITGSARLPFFTLAGVLMGLAGCWLRTGVSGVLSWTATTAMATITTTAPSHC